MANPPNRFQQPRDTSPLGLEQLSDHELATILYIERRLYEAQQGLVQKEPTKNIKPYLAPAQVRHPHVLLLDGGRGTGKTSILLTLVHRWTPANDADVPCHDVDTEVYRKRIERVQSDVAFTPGEHDFHIPTHVSVVGRILDFDPLPPEMPLIAGIIQAWRPLAERFDRLLGHPDDCDKDGYTPMMDFWHRLFRVAAVGWTAISKNSGLIEQVLDRQEQVEDWQRLDEHWREFVHEVIKRGKCLQGIDQIDPKPVFVIMIDDVDLQVGRIRELLPALRLLYHPNVIFLVAADRRHLIDMLKLDFLGQQNRLANCQFDGDALSASNQDPWASILAKSSFDKVFPLRNRWKLDQLYLHELLDFPNGREENLKTILNGWPQQKFEMGDFGPLGDYLAQMAGTAEDPIEIPPIMPYRAAHQIFGQASVPEVHKERALEAIRQIIGRSDSDDLVRVTKRRERSEPGPSIEYLATGGLTALFPEGFRVKIDNEGEIILSAQPHFVYLVYRDEPSRRLIPMTSSADDVAKVSSVIALSLRADGYGVVAPGLQWNIHLALAWTNVSLFEGDLNLELAFRWQLHEHPSPLRLLNWTKDWGNFIHELSGGPGEQLELERIAYAWIYYQLHWLRLRGKKRNKKNEVWAKTHPCAKKFKADWQALLSIDPEIGSLDEKERWRKRSLPLMARPELGLPPSVQELLLAPVENQSDIDWLKAQRRHRVTDAIIAFDEKVGRATADPENQEQADRATQVFDQRYKRVYQEDSPWFRKIET